MAHIGGFELCRGGAGSTVVLHILLSEESVD